MTGDGASAARLLIRRLDLAAPVLERIVAALAARVDLPLDRLSDAQIASLAVVNAAGPHLDDGAICLDFDGAPGTVVVRVGPLPPGAAARVIRDTAVPGVGEIVERLVDRLSVEQGGGGQETLSLTIGAEGGPARPS